MTADRTVNYVYGPEHQRVRQTLTLNSNGFVFAQITKETGTGAGPNQSRYLHYDHQGSIAAISDATGTVVERLAYDPWGKRRSSNGVADPLDALVGVNTERGYTLHEHIDEVGVINMNGRVYDPPTDHCFNGGEEACRHCR